jgi:hypothetical protein
MSQGKNVRWAWLRGMYIYTIVVAGGLGLGIIIMPEATRSMLGWPSQGPIVLGIIGSLYVSFLLLSILGLRSPLKFSPVLLLQLGYKVVWFIGIILPIVLRAKFPSYAIVQVVIFATYIIGDLIAIPFWYVFSKESDR